MDQSEILYGFDSLVITGALFLIIILFNEAGFRIGRYIQKNTDAEIRALTGSIQASILGLLALLLGFTFSMAMQRFDNRSQALIAEANAIGTAALRVQLLPASYQEKAAALLRDYVGLRIEIGQIDLTRFDDRVAFGNRISSLQNALWDLAVAAAREDPRPVTTGAFVTALNDLIDQQGKRNALLNMHVPEVVLILLFIVFIAASGILGYSSGLTGGRVLVPIVLVSFLICMIVFIIIDLDRPKRGLIQVDQSAMLDLRS